MTPLVSIVIPCRNGAAWLSENIRSCLNQSWSNLEIIVIDNASTDNSLAVARTFERHGVIVLQCDWQGASTARNFGLERANGDLIQFLDADDVLHTDKIRIQVERLAAAPPDAVASSAWARFRDSPSEAVFVPEPVWRDFTPEEFLIASWLGGGMMPNFAWLTPRTLIERAGPWDETLSLNDDGEFFSRIVLAASSVACCLNARGYYRGGHYTSLSRRRDREALSSAYAATDLSCGYLLRRCTSERARQACAAHYQRFAYDAYPDAPDLVAKAERRAIELGGSTLKPGGGPGFQLLSRGFGWKCAKRCQVAWHKLRQATAVTQ